MKEKDVILIWRVALISVGVGAIVFGLEGSDDSITAVGRWLNSKRSAIRGLLPW